MYSTKSNSGTSTSSRALSNLQESYTAESRFKINFNIIYDQIYKNRNMQQGMNTNLAEVNLDTSEKLK